MNDTRMNLMYKTLAENKFQELENMSEDLRCVLCRQILNNARQLICGCRFCKACIDELVKRKDSVCPGNSDDCKNERIFSLFDIQIDHRANKNVAKLTVKCPKKSCFFQCLLIDLGNHMHNCMGREKRCPFYDLGCENVDIEISTHFDVEITSHSQMLIDNISILKNEISSLKLFLSKTSSEVDLLRNSNSLKEQQINCLVKDVQTIQIENLNLVKEITTLKLKYKRNQEPPKPLSGSDFNFSHDLIWDITDLLKKRESGMRLGSELFHSKQHKYQLQLLLYTNGYPNVGLRSFTIYLYIWNGRLKWPFEADVTFKFSSIASLRELKTISIPCKISKPIFIYSWSCPFNFDYDSLQNEDGQIEDNISIQCFIKE